MIDLLLSFAFGLVALTGGMAILLGLFYFLDEVILPSVKSLHDKFPGWLKTILFWIRVVVIFGILTLTVYLIGQGILSLI